MTETRSKLFRTPAINLYSHDVLRLVRFYEEQLGFRETFRTPSTGTPDHVEVALDGSLSGSPRSRPPLPSTACGRT